MNELEFNPNQYQVKEVQLDGRKLTYRAFEDIVYCTNPKADIQKLNIYVPEVYYEGKEINGYSLTNAPIFMPNTVGGYMEGPRQQPGVDRRGNPNSVFEALDHGYVVVSAGIRGRNTGRISDEFFEGGKAEIEGKEGIACGKAPAFVVDMKAAIRYLRLNKNSIPGNTDYIITNGTSAGGALSALTGSSGNCQEYEPYLEEIGAAKQKDNIFAASCYCPIINLENADAAYEWQFNKEHLAYGRRFKKVGNEIVAQQNVTTFSAEQIELSDKLKEDFSSYLNSLHLMKDGKELTLDESGEGSFLDYIKTELVKSSKTAAKYRSNAEERSYLEIADYFDGDEIIWDKFVAAQTRMKAVPSFDDLNLRSPENEEFGDENVKARHFSQSPSLLDKGEFADGNIIKMMNPMEMIESGEAAKHWRIRHGSFDRDTSLAIPIMLERKLANLGYDVDFALPWGLPHSGDYDLEDLFAWIDQKVKEDM